jgi:ABC-2 type transport system permease protein
MQPNPAHFRRPTALILHQFRFDLRAVRRDRQATVTTVIMPIVLLAAFVGLGHHQTIILNGHRTSVAGFYVPGLIAFAIVASSFATLLIDLVNQRQNGVLKRRRATPVPAWALISGRILTCLVITFATGGVLLLVGRNSYDLSIPADALPAIAVTTLLGCLAFACFAYAIAPLIRNATAAQPIIQLVLLPLYVISGVLLPDSKTPDLLRNIARAFPLQHIANGLHRAFSASPGIGMTSTDLAVLGAWIAVTLAIATKYFRWMPR